MKYVIYLWLCICFFSCKQSAKQISMESASVDDTLETSIVQKSLPELIAEELFFKGKDIFGNVIELKGTQIVADTVIFKIQGAESIVKEDKLLLNTNGQFLLFHLPDFRFEGFYGKWGNGPDEFIYPHIVPAKNDNSLLCYLFESAKGKLYGMDKSGQISAHPFRFDNPEGGFKYSSKQIVNIAPDDFIYADDSPTGKSIFRATVEADTVSKREVFNLGLNSKRISPFSYIGDFVANPNKNRMVYAYKYFKMIKFMDLEAQTVRTINFEREVFDENTLYKINGLDQNVTHYWGACAQDEYVYFLYSGRTPYDVAKDNGKHNFYIFVEQYDWNGNPVNKFKLDQWGYFTVDEPNKKLYLMSTNHDDPFFIYDLPSD